MLTTPAALWATIGILLGLAGLGSLALLRLGRTPERIVLAGVGRVSRVTLVVVGLALVGAGYHLFTHALGLMHRFRAPLPAAIGVAIVAILLSIAIDAMENRLAGDTADGGDAGDAD